MNNFGIKSAGAAHNEKQNNERKTLEWQVKNLLPLIDNALSIFISNPLNGGHPHDLTRETYAKRQAFSRFVDGHKEYGAALFEMSDSDLRKAYDEEIADAIVYRAELLRREWYNK